MRFFETLFAGAALVAAALAVEINDFPASIEPGKTYTITYSPADNTPTTFILRQGKNEDLSTLETLTTSATGGKFEWTVPEDLPNASDYALEIKQGTEVNYIGPIALSGSDATSSASASSASSTASGSTTSARSVSSATTSASGSISSSVSGNSTISSATLSRTTGTGTSRPTGSSTPTESSGAPENTGAASTLGSSPMALIFGAVAAMAYIN